MSNTNISTCYNRNTMGSGLTTNYFLHYPISTDPVDVATDVQQLATDVDTVLVNKLGTSAPSTNTANFTVESTDYWLINNKVGSSCTVTLPAASANTGRQIVIKTLQAQTVVSASSNVVPLTGTTAGTAILAATAGKWATLVSDGANWVIMQAG